MSELKNCFKALGLNHRTATAQDVNAAYEFQMNLVRSNTEADKLLQQELGKLRDRCLAELLTG